MLHAEVIEGSRPARTALFLHGILGSGRNWRSFARQLADRHPGWRFVLPDLRNHGDSPARPGPHTLAACADDLRELARVHGAPTVVVGHSFGGKVALVLARALGPAGGLRHVAVLDAPPTPAAAFDPEVTAVLSAVRAAPQDVPREEIRAFLRERGLADGIVAWLLTSTRQVGGRWRWKYDVDGIEAMLRDYAAADLLPFVEHLPGDLDALFVIAGRSGRWDPQVRARLDAAPRVRAEVLPRAGHWVQVDDPAGLTALLDPLFADPV